MNRMIVPEFLKNFKCIGSQCENTCCAEWNITVDKHTYLKYSKVKEKNLKKLIKNNIKLNNLEEINNYAIIKLNDEKVCPFLDEKKLCTIHKELGEKGLSHTCSVYPRTFNKIGNIYEKSATLSCPEVARAALLKSNKMAFRELEVSEYFTFFTQVKEKETENLVWITRIFTIDLLQNRDFKLWERLIILGLFFEEASAVIKNKDEKKLLDIVNSFNLLLKTDEIKLILGAYNTDTSFQLNVITLLKETRMLSSSPNKIFLQCLDEFSKGLNMGGNLEENRYDLYNNNYTNYYAPFMDAHEYIMENYLVHYVFTEIFPFKNDNDAFEEYVMLVLNYALVKAYLIGMSGFHKKLDESIIVKLIHSLHRTYHHGDKIMHLVYEELKNNNAISLKSMTYLIRN